MLLTRELRLSSPLLATKPNKNVDPPRREFVKTPTDGGFNIRNDLARWNWAFLEARDALSFVDVSVAAIIPSTTYFTKSTSTYWRTFRRGVGGAVGKEAFEAISSGRIIVCKFTLAGHLPPDCDGGRFTRPPDVVEFDQMLNHIGEHLGMSEWGHAFLYGRFAIKDNILNGNDS